MRNRSETASRTIARTDEPVLVFDFGAAGLPRRVFHRPVRTLIARTLAEVKPALLEIDRAARAGQWAAGYISYEAAPAFEPHMRVHPAPKWPLLWFGIYDAPVSGIVFSDSPAPAIVKWTPSATRAEYDAAIAHIREEIAAGTTYQVNYTTRLRAPFQGDAAALYERLRRAQGDGLHAFLHLGGSTVLSSSPELFFSRRGDRVLTRPMKGTRARGRWPEEDDAHAAALLASEKERAENLMIVDLLRNDLGRVARTGTVKVDELFAIERYPTVLQMTSTISAQVDPAVTLAQLFTALFPCGSVTGAPKISTMDVIAALEPEPREVYCGAIGMVEPGGDCIFNVPIRTLLIDHAAGIAEYGVGGGITWDSSAASEYEELLAKAAILSYGDESFYLLETMRLDDGDYPRRALHLDRLRDSARYFGFAFDAGRVNRALDGAAREHPAGSWKVRLLLDSLGQPTLEASPIEPAQDVIETVALATRPVSSEDRFLFHKTTHREVYEAHDEWPDAWDVMLWNEAGELTEFTRGNLVLELAGERVTPPRECGLLAGVFRRSLLESGEVVERNVTLNDLARCTAIWHINGVRGWTRVSLPHHRLHHGA